VFFSHAVTSAHWSGREKEPTPFLIPYLLFLLVYMALYPSFLYFYFTYRLPLIFWPLAARVWCNSLHERQYYALHAIFNELSYTMWSFAV
jgi:hypothetical protein